MSAVIPFPGRPGRSETDAEHQVRVRGVIEDRPYDPGRPLELDVEGFLGSGIRIVEATPPVAINPSAAAVPAAEAESPAIYTRDGCLEESCADNPDRDEDGPWVSGEARCLACDHEWIAVSPAGAGTTPAAVQCCVGSGFECPKCNLFYGAYIGMNLRRDEAHFQCACGSDLFRITERVIYCPICGQTHQPYD